MAAPAPLLERLVPWICAYLTPRPEGRRAMERSWNGIPELLTLTALFFSPLLYDLSQWVQKVLAGG